MIRKLHIKNFKCFSDETIEFRKLTVLTGENSSGKSSLIQALLYLGHNPLIGSPFTDEIKQYLFSLGSIRDVSNKFENAKEFTLSAELSSAKKLETTYSQNPDNSMNIHVENMVFPNELTYVYNMYYLNADRVRPRRENPLLQNSSDEYKLFGIMGQFVSSYFEVHKRDVVKKYLICDDTSYTLETQVNYWLKKITGIDDIGFNTEKISSNSVKSFFEFNGFEFSPENIGTGMSYLVSILVIALSAKKGNIIIIENPEIHLHPKSQAALGEFLAFIASKGIQLIIETHNDHIINKICYEEYKDKIKSEEVVIYYKSDQFTPFEKIEIKEGQFWNERGENRFPTGFFDATLKEIFEING